jgi:hypothetical protein
MRKATWDRWAGTALVCLGLLAYEILSTRLLSVVLEGHLIVFAIALAMLGMGIATSFLSLQDSAEKLSKPPLTFSYAATWLGFCYLISLGFLTFVNNGSNAVLEGAMDRGGLDALVASIRASMNQKMNLIALILLIPYFAFGILIGWLFRSASQSDYHKLYASDLIGAAAGCVLAVLALDYFGYAGCLVLILVATFLAAAAFSRSHSKMVATANVCLSLSTVAFLWSPSLLAGFEPRPALNQLARNYDKTNEVTEVWHTWNAHSRIALLSMKDRKTGQITQVYSHEDGSGWAYAPGITSYPWAKFVTMFKPKRVLVLFAGVGADMFEIDRLCNGQCEIKGVEINRDMVEDWQGRDHPQSQSLPQRPGISLEVSEAREFLERDRSQYDAILLSWWGAGTSNYVGTSGKLAQYLYTTEAYEALLRHLTPDGMLILLNGSKAQSLVNLRAVFDKLDLGSLASRTVIAREPTTGPVVSGPQFYDILERMRLIIKPSGISQSEMQTIQAIVDELKAELILSPDYVEPAHTVYRDIVDGVDLDEINARLIASDNAELSIVTDDRPFINELVPREYYLSVQKWFEPQTKSIHWAMTQAVFRFVLAVTAVAIILTIGPLVLRSGPALTSGNLVELFYFGSLGAGFVLIEVGLVRKLGLLLGHPSYSISIVLASLILWTGLGALFSGSAFDRGLLTVKRTALLIAAYSIGGLALYESTVGAVIGLPLIVKCAIVVVALAPLGFLMGRLFPQGLLRVSGRDRRLIPWAWAINSTASTVSVGIGYLISYPLGFNALIYVGAAIYLGIIALPLAKGEKVPAALAATAS